MSMGVAGYSFWQNQNREKEPSINQEPSESPDAENLSLKSPDQNKDQLANKVSPVKLSYHLPDGWETVQDTSETLEIGYDPNISESSTSYITGGVAAVGKWESNPTRKISGNYTAVVGMYDGGSRHTNLLSGHLGLSEAELNSGIWKYPNYYFEREYLYNGWPCLVIFGFSSSQTPGVQGICPIGSTRAIFISSDSTFSDKEADLTKFERYLQTIRYYEKSGI